MKENTPDEILGYIAVITENRDCVILEKCIIQTIYEIINCEKVYFIKTEPDTITCQYLFSYDHTGLKDHGEPSPDDFDGIPANIINQSKESRVVETISLRNHTISVYPIIVLRHIIGFIAIRIQKDHVIDKNLLKNLIKIYQNYISLLTDNQQDALTGLLNRKTFDEHMFRLLEIKSSKDMEALQNNERRKGRKSNMFWLAIFDIDNFKRINDRFGHIYGDEVLILLVRIIKETFRDDDLFFRYGGEEFIIVIDSPDRDTAYALFEKFRKNVENYKFPQVGQVTISLGMVEILDNEIPTTIVGHADQALYYSKKSGKNRISEYEDLLERGLVTQEKSSSNITIF